MSTLGKLLPKSQAKLLTQKAKNLTKAQLEKEIQSHQKELSGIESAMKKAMEKEEAGSNF